MDRNVFQSLAFDVDAENDDSFQLEPEGGYESEGEEFNYIFPPDEDLPAVDPDSDEEYILTELGPVLHTLDMDDEPSATNGAEMGDMVTDDADDQPIQVDTTEGSKVFKSKDGTEWSSVPDTSKQKTPSKNIFKPPRTKINNAQSAVDPGSTFNLFLPTSIITDLVKYTNLEGERVDGDKWKPTDAIEIQALIGAYIHLGAMNQNIFPSELIWDVKNGNQLVRSAFTRNRFLKLGNMLRFDDKATRTERRQRDVFAPIRDVWEKFLSTLKKHYNPGPFVTVDEQLIPWRGRCIFLQYLPSKPDKYGLKVFWCADAETMYPLTAKPYLGKIARTPQVNLGRNTALELVQPFFGSGRNLTCDNFFTDMELSKQLTAAKTTVVGTLRRNKTFIPPEFQDPKGTEKGKSKFAYRKECMMVSYKSGSKKNVILLSSMHNDGSMVTKKVDKTVPEVVDFYNSTKGGVDCLDLMAHSMTTKRQTKRWPMVIFFNILDMASVASNVIFKIKFPEHKLSKQDNRRFFQLDIANSFLFPQIQRRRLSKNLPRQLASSMDLVLGSTGQTVQQTTLGASVSASKRKRCAKCPSKADKKTPVACCKCNLPICKDHTYYCFACADGQ